MTMANEITTPAAPAPHPDFTKPPAAQGENRAAPAPAPAAQTVPFTMDQVQRFIAIERELNEIKAAKQTEVEQAKQAELLAMAKAGDSEKALEEQRKIGQQKEADALKRYAALEQKVFDKVRESVVNDVLSGHTIAGETPEVKQARAKILRSILLEQIEVSHGTDGDPVARDKASGRPAVEVLRDRLSDPTLAIFFAPNSRGGSGSDGTRPPANQDQSAPGSLEAIAAQFKAKQGQYAPMGLGPVG